MYREREKSSKSCFMKTFNYFCAFFVESKKYFFKLCVGCVLGREKCRKCKSWTTYSCLEQCACYNSLRFCSFFIELSPMLKKTARLFPFKWFWNIFNIWLIKSMKRERGPSRNDLLWYFCKSRQPWFVILGGCFFILHKFKSFFHSNMVSNAKFPWQIWALKKVYQTK